jgi:hypothetical protein
MTLIIALPLWAPVALFGTGVLAALLGTSGSSRSLINSTVK